MPKKTTLNERYNRQSVFINKDLHSKLKQYIEKENKKNERTNNKTMYELLNMLVKDFLNKAGIK